MARVHRAGLLGFTGIGWVIAAAYSAAHVAIGVRQRTALMVLDSAQALLFQLAAAAGLFVLVGCVLAGFLLLGGANDFLPEVPVVDPFTLGGGSVIVAWIAAAIGTPVWYFWTLRQAWRAARRSAAGGVYAYPIVGRLVWDEAPRIWQWIVIEPDPPDSDRALESRE